MADGFLELLEKPYGIYGRLCHCGIFCGVKLSIFLRGDCACTRDDAAKGNSGSVLCGAFADMVGSFIFVGGNLFSGGAAQSVRQYFGRIKKHTGFSSGNGKGIQTSFLELLLLYLSSCAEALFVKWA